MPVTKADRRRYAADKKRPHMSQIYLEMHELYTNSTNRQLDNPHFVLGINKAREFKEHCERAINKKLMKGFPALGGWAIIVDSNMPPDTCMIDRSDFPVDSYWEE